MQKPLATRRALGVCRNEQEGLALLKAWGRIRHAQTAEDMASATREALLLPGVGTKVVREMREFDPEWPEPEFGGPCAHCGGGTSRGYGHSWFECQICGGV